MINGRLKEIIRKNFVFYIIGALAVLWFKIFSSGAESEELDWILAPTARWVEFLSGIPFEKEAHAGYINHPYRVIIAPSCSGVRFMVSAFAALLYPFVHRLKTRRSGFCWMLLSFGGSYLFTVFANGIRIVLSIFVQMPEALHGWITPGTFHTIEGMAVYFTFLFIVYQAAGHASLKLGGLSGPGESRLCLKRLILHRCLPPALCYFSFTLGVPLVRGAYRDDPGKFAEYAMLMFALFLAVTLLFCLVFAIRRRFYRRQGRPNIQ